MRRYAGSAAQQSDGAAENASERRRRRRAWRITDLASSGPAAPDTPSTAASVPPTPLSLSPPSPSTVLRPSVLPSGTATSTRNGTIACAARLLIYERDTPLVFIYYSASEVRNCCREAPRAIFSFLNKGRLRNVCAPITDGSREKFV